MATPAQIDAAKRAFVRALNNDEKQPWHLDHATDRWERDDVYNVDGEFKFSDAMAAVIDAAEKAVKKTR